MADSELRTQLGRPDITSVVKGKFAYVRFFRDAAAVAAPIAEVSIEDIQDISINAMSQSDEKVFHYGGGKEYRMIDYYENRLKDIPHYCRVLRGLANEQEMREAGITEGDNERRSNYLYDTHFMPHDIDTVVLGMDKTRKQQFIEGGVKPIVKVSRIPVKNDAIEMARSVFSEVWFDTERCERGIECLSNYRYQYNDDRDTHNSTPHHDWSSNGADAFMQFAQGYTVKEDRQPINYKNRKRSIA